VTPLFSSPESRYANDGYSAWLRYPRLSSAVDVPPRVVRLGSGIELDAAAREIRFSFDRLFGQSPSVGFDLSAPSLVVGVVDDLEGIDLPRREELKPDGFLIFRSSGHLIVTGLDSRGVLYGTFALLRKLSAGTSLDLAPGEAWLENPRAPIRFLNHWDNPDGTIERGYAGRSIFFRDGFGGLITEDLARVTDYARLLASVGINGCSLNNVNTDERIYSSEGLAEMRKLADAMRPYGVRALLSVSLESPRTMGGLSTFDPLDAKVAGWWREKAAEIYREIPDLAGLILKADSEGRLGPSAYGRTHADAANVVASALAPFGGLFFYRGFVYNHRMDWRDLSLDRARAAYDNFMPLDGAFADNAIVQIKNGPIDFQVREPASPCFSALEKTNKVIEVMITQEYLGQQHHTVYEVPWWKDTFDFELDGTPVKDLVGGFVAVCGVGRDENWLGNHLAQANLYGYGRLCWDPSLSSQAISNEWTSLTFSREPFVVDEVRQILMRSWPVYEAYTGNMGIGGLTDIIQIHYGPSPISSEHNGWGQWHRSKETGTGMNRTVATGTGFAGQYPPQTAAMFESLSTCPEELLLFFHHVPYAHRLQSGKTIIQHFYDEHYRGAEEVGEFVARWRKLEGHIDDARFREVLAQLKYQAGHAKVWRDSVCHWFARLSGIPDEQGRVGNEPNRIEAESMTLDGYEVVTVEPWEAASGGQAIQLSRQSGTATFAFPLPSGTYDIATWYFDTSAGHPAYALSVNGNEIDSWRAVRDLPTTKLDAHSRARRMTPTVSLATNDVMVLKGLAEGEDLAGIDFIEFVGQTLLLPA